MVYVLICADGRLVGLYTSPVDAAEMQKLYPESVVSQCSLNAEACVGDGMCEGNRVG